MSGPTYTPSKSAIRDQLHGTLLRLNKMASVQASDQVPEGLIPGTRGDLVLDTRNGVLWIKTTGTPNGAPSTTGWVQLAANLSPREFGSINWEFGPGVDQVGSDGGFVNVVGPGTLATGAQGFSSPGPNILQYNGLGGTFFARAQLGFQAQNADVSGMQLRFAIDGVAVPNSEMTVVRGTTQGTCLTTSAQLDLEPGNQLTVQIFNDGGSASLIATGFGVQINRVD